MMREAIVRIAARHGATEVRLGETLHPGTGLPGCDRPMRSGADRLGDARAEPG